MSEILIYGASDDLVEVVGCDGADEFSAYDQVWRADLVGPDGAMRLHALYDSCWHIAVGQVDDGAPLPEWPCRLARPGLRGVPPYSTGLIVEAPEGTKLVNVGRYR